MNTYGNGKNTASARLGRVIETPEGRGEGRKEKVVGRESFFSHELRVAAAPHAVYESTNGCTSSQHGGQQNGRAETRLNLTFPTALLHHPPITIYSKCIYNPHIN